MKGAWERYWFDDRPLERVALLRFVILAALLWAIRVHEDAVLQAVDGLTFTHLHREWRPIWIFKALALPPPTATGARVELGLIYAAIAFGIVGLWTRTSVGLAALLGIHWMGVAYSFGKPHHDFVATTFALAALPFAPIGARWSLDAWCAARRGEPRRERGTFAAFPLRVAQVSAAIGYFFAGASKVAIGGLAWMNGYSLQAVLLSTSADWSGVAARSVALCRVMSIITVIAQGLFPLALVFPLLRWFFVPAVIAFHLVSWKTMDTGPFLTLWFTLAAFVPLERIVRREFWLATAPRRALAVVAAAALVALGYVYFSLVSIAWLALAPIPWLGERAIGKGARLTRS
jgi:hypothetical protein